MTITLHARKQDQDSLRCLLALAISIAEQIDGDTLCKPEVRSRARKIVASIKEADELAIQLSRRGPIFSKVSSRE